MDFKRSHRPIQEINLTALIDIVFHILVFVMFTTTFVVSESIELSLPSAQTKNPTTGAATNAGKVMRILITQDGMLNVDHQPMNNDGLNSLLVSRLAVNPDEKIAIFTTPGVTVQQLVSVMDTVYLTGGRNVQVDKAS
jgi:biopolymer transport protein ExbD